MQMFAIKNQSSCGGQLQLVQVSSWEFIHSSLMKEMTGCPKGDLLISCPRSTDIIYTIRDAMQILKLALIMIKNFAWAPLLECKKAQEPLCDLIAEAFLLLS